MTVENSPKDTNPTPVSENLPSCEKPGQLLKEKREALGISALQAATDLNFLPLYIPSLENEDFKPLHNPTFIKGYLRAYARYLKLDVDRVLYCFAHHYPELAVQENKPPVEIMKPDNNTSGFIFKLLSLVLVGALLALIIVWWQSGKEDLPLNNNLTQVKVETLQGTVDASNLPTQAVEAETTQPAKPLPPAKPLAEAQVKEVTEKKLQEDNTQEKPSEILNKKAARFLGNLYLATSGKANSLGLVFTDPCWVEVRDANQTLLHADLMQAEEQVLVEGTAPFKIIFGNGTAAQVIYLGEDFNFKNKIRPNGYTSLEVGKN